MLPQEVFVVAEQVHGQLTPVSFELLGAAKKLAKEMGGASISCVLLGADVSGQGANLASHGADKVYLAEDPRLALYQNEYYALFLTEFFKKKQPEVVLWGATAISGELAATVAARLETGLSAHCSDLHLNEEGLLVQVVPAFGGKVLGDILCPTRRPQMATVKPGIFSSLSKGEGAGEIIQEDTSILAGCNPLLKTLRVTKEKDRDASLKEAAVVVGGGWGVGSGENWKMLKRLSSLLGGAVGCTRPALDEGWTDGEHTMIGTSGITIKPKVYIGVGISGAIHHLVGIKDAEMIISINKDAKAPILSFSDYGVVADFKKVIQGLIERIEELT